MKLIGCAIVIVSTILVCGCAATMPGPGQPAPGVLFSSTTSPAGMTIDQEYQAYPDSFEVLGFVEGTSSNQNILGVIAVGNGGYRAAIDNAVKKSGADGLINCVADIQSTNVLFLFSTSKTIVRGLAIKRK